MSHATTVREKIFSSLPHRNFRIFTSKVQGSEDASSQQRNRQGPVAPRTHRQSIFRAANYGRCRALDGPPRRARSAEHLHSARGVRTAEEAGAVVVARKRLQRDDLARAQGLLRPRAASGAACRHWQEISGDVRLPRSLRQGMGARPARRTLSADRCGRSDLAAERAAGGSVGSTASIGGQGSTRRSSPHSLP